MDRNALTEQRRENVIGLLKGMNIKKSDAEGFDKDSVYECMQKLCDLYEKNIEDLENSYEGELIELKDKYQKYDDNNELYVSLIMEAKKSSNEIINQAKNEVESILNEGKAQIAKQEQEVNALREAMDAEKVAMRAEAEAEKEKASALKNKYTQQLNAMEEEFAEIKTNILRTAGKMDSLKSKFSDDEEANWNVINDVDAIDFPSAEIGVEEIVVPEMPTEGVPAADFVYQPQTTGLNIPETPAVQEKFATPAVPETPVVQDAFAMPAAQEVFEPSAATAELTPSTEPAAPVEEAVPEINFDNIEIDLHEFKEESVEDAVEEISFEGLEELFKEDK